MLQTGLYCIAVLSDGLFFSKNQNTLYTKCKMASDNWRSGYVCLCNQSYQSGKFLHIPLNVDTSVSC